MISLQTFDKPNKISDYQQIENLRHGQVLYKFPIDLQQNGLPGLADVFLGSVCIMTDNTLTIGDDNQKCISVIPYGKVSLIVPEFLSVPWVMNFVPLVGGGTYKFDELIDGSWFILPEIADIPDGSALFDDDEDSK